MSDTGFIVPRELAGQRLDAVLRHFLPLLGLRGHRRAIEAGLVLLNGRLEKSLCRLREGDRLTVADAPAVPEPKLQPRFLARQGEYVFLDKPAGLHCAHLAGKPGPSLEAMLTALLAGPPLSLTAGDCRGACLLQRLDFETSGLVCAALNAETAAAFRAAEREGRCDKRYLTLLRGRLPGRTTARAALDTDKRRKSRVKEATAEETRWTEFLPLRFLNQDQASRLLTALATPLPAPPSGLTLAACRIRRGARHQIRAHAALLGYPLWGDALYDDDAEGKHKAAPAFFLHHGALLFPGGRCSLPPPWPLPPELSEAVQKWLADDDKTE